VSVIFYVSAYDPSCVHYELKSLLRRLEILIHFSSSPCTRLPPIDCVLLWNLCILLSFLCAVLYGPCQVGLLEYIFLLDIFSFIVVVY
jgi:hypothetical protein